MRQIVNDQKMNTLSLGLESVHSDRIFSNGSTKDSDTDLVDWLTDLNVGKEVIEKVKTFCSFLKQLKSVEMFLSAFMHSGIMKQINSSFQL